MSSFSEDETRRDGSNQFIVIKSLFTLWNDVPSALVLKPLNWIWFMLTNSVDWALSVWDFKNTGQYNAFLRNQQNFVVLFYIIIFDLSEDYFN